MKDKVYNTSDEAFDAAVTWMKENLDVSEQLSKWESNGEWRVLYYVPERTGSMGYGWYEHKVFKYRKNKKEIK